MLPPALSRRLTCSGGVAGLSPVESELYLLPGFESSQPRQFDPLPLAHHPFDAPRQLLEPGGRLGLAHVLLLGKPGG